MVHGVWRLAAAAALAVPGWALAQADAGNEYARGRLISERQSLAPGVTNYIGLTFEIEPGWHLYWKGANDSGFPPQIDLNLPEGYKLGEIQWPAPKRYVMPGDMLDHVYEERVTLVLPLVVPPNATGEVRITGKTEFLVCQEVCLPGGGPVRLTVPIGGPGVEQPSADARLITEALDRVPRPLPKEDSPISWRLDGAVMEITSTQGKNIFFYPAEDCIPLVSALEDGASKTGTLRLRLKDMSFGPRVKGVLEIRPDAKGKSGAKEPPKFYTIDLPVADAAPPLAAPKSGR